MRGTILALGVFGSLALSCLTPAQARADLQIAFGTRWDPLKYTVAVTPTPMTMPATGATTADTSKVLGSIGNGFQTTDLNPYLALYFAQKYGVVLSLDLGYGKFSNVIYNNPPTPNTVLDSSYFQFGFSLGFKMYITKPRSQKISPYIYADFFKYFATLSMGQQPTGDLISGINNSDTASYLGSLLSPVGGTVAFGAEYFFTPGFSVGSEILGLRIAYSGGDLYTPALNMMTGMMTSTIGRTDSYAYVTFYTGITLNYRFQVHIQSSIHTSQAEESPDEAAAPKKSPTRPAETPSTPATPPPPSPEAVD